MKAMVLAAGRGERMRPLTLETPKPLLQAGGKPLIVHQIERLAACGITDLVINHSWLGDQLEAALGAGDSLGVSIAWSREEEPLETAGGIIKALPLLRGDRGPAPFICVNADIWTDYSFNALPELSGQDSLAWLVLVDNPAQHPEGDFILENGKVREPGASRRHTCTYSGIAVYHPDLFSGETAGKKSVTPLLRGAMAQGRVGGEYYAGRWFDIGTPERLRQLDRLLRTDPGATDRGGWS